MRNTLNALVRGVAFFVLGTALASSAIAQTAGRPSGSPAASSYPDRPVKLLVGFAPGGSVDTAARILADGLRQRLNQQVVVDNRPGASGMLAGDLVAKGEADGYTLLFSSNGALTINPHLVAKPLFDPVADFAAVARVAQVDAVFVVNNDVPARTFPEFVALARKSPGKYAFGSSGNGGPTHLAGELLKKSAGIDMTHIPYKGDAPALVDVIGGTTPAAIPVMPSVKAFIKAGRVRALATFGEKRSSDFPELPTVAESGYPGFFAGAWYVVVAPAKTPQPIVVRLAAEIEATLKDPEIIKRMEAANVTPFPSASPQVAAAFIKTESDKWGALIRSANIAAN